MAGRRTLGLMRRDAGSAKQPIAAIQKRVIDAEAFADLSPSAVVILLLLARNLDKGRNGHVFLAADDAERHGIDRKTLYRCFVELQVHGFIFPTKRGGNGLCGRYAVTWLSLSKDTRGLYVDAFIPCAWRNWRPTAKKKRGVKMSPSSGQISPFAPELVDKFTPSMGTNFPTLNVIPILCGTRRDWIPSYLSELKAAGLAGQQCFQIPARMEAT
jgi:hypothetical protein